MSPRTPLPAGAVRAGAVAPARLAAPGPDDVVARAAEPLTPGRVTGLQAVRGAPCVSLLLTTTPAPVMTRSDAARLDALAAEAVRRLQRVPGGADDAVLARLDAALHEAAEGPAGAGLAVYVSASTSDVVALPVPVRDRVVVDPTFATRDLVRALHRTPRHVVLLLSATQARLLTGVADRLEPALTTQFPVQRAGGGRRVAGPVRAEREQSPRDRDAATAAYLREVDQSLGTYLRLWPAPLVLVGPERLLAAFRGLSRNLGRLAGSVTGHHTDAPLADLVARVRPVLDAYLHSRQEEALELLERRTGSGRVVEGIDGVWAAAHHDVPEMLAVEDDLQRPARVVAHGVIEPADDVDGPDVVDDVVDELIEVVLHRGGWVALMQPGRLASRGGVALTLRRV